MNQVHHWLQGKAQKSRKVPSLDEALLFGRQGAYALYRLRFLAIRAGLRTVLHTLETLLFALVVWREFFPYFLVLRSSMAMFSGLYWGWLEQLRGEVRHNFKKRRYESMRVSIDRWLKLAWWIVVLQMLGLVGVLNFFPTPFRSFSILDAYYIACFLRLAMDTISRTYHAGIYAIRRVYWPLSSLLAADIIEVAAILLLIRFLGPWCFAPALLIGGLVRAALTYFYTSRMYQRSRIPAFSWRRFYKSKLPAAPALWSAVKHAAANFGLQLDAWLIVALVSAESGDGGHIFLATLFHLFRPLIGACAVWARVFYFDFVRLESSMLQLLRIRFESFLRRVAWAAALLVGVLLMVAAPIVLGKKLPWHILALLIPFLILRSHLALYQVQAFSYRLYKRLVRLGFGVLLALLLVWLLQTKAHITLICLSLTLFLTLIWARRQGTETERTGPPISVMGFYEWLAHLNNLTVPARVWIGTCNRHLIPVGRVVRELSNKWPEAYFTRFSRDRFLMCETSGLAMQQMQEQIVINAAGVLSHLSAGDVDRDGTAALLHAIGGLDKADPLRQLFAGEPIESEQLKQNFCREIPDGLLIDSGSGVIKAPSTSQNAANRDFVGQVLMALRKLANGQKHSLRSTIPYEISVFSPCGQPQLIFAIPRGVNPDIRNRWRLLIQQASALSSLQ